ncbi:MAG: hypothetical protein ABIS20_00665 [Thermoanaerobaculia bacterium]
MKTRSRWLRRMHAGLLVPALLLLGCGDSLPPLQIAPLAGSSMELGKFEGRWFDGEGNLIVVVDGRRTPQLGLRLPQWLSLAGTRLQDGQILFYVRNGPLGRPIPGSLNVLGEDRVVMRQVFPPAFKPLGFLCGNALAIPETVLVRDPSSMWFVKLSAIRATRLATKTYKKVYESIFDRLSRIL